MSNNVRRNLAAVAALAALTLTGVAEAQTQKPQLRPSKSTVTVNQKQPVLNNTAPAVDFANNQQFTPNTTTANNRYPTYNNPYNSSLNLNPYQSVQNNFVNPNPVVAPGLTLKQWEYNQSVVNKVNSQNPFYSPYNAYNPYNPYQQVPPLPYQTNPYNPYLANPYVANPYGPVNANPYFNPYVNPAFPYANPYQQSFNPYLQNNFPLANPYNMPGVNPANPFAPNVQTNPFGQ